METSLFRPEVLDAYANRWIGDARHGIGVSAVSVLAVVLCATFALIILVLACSYSSRGVVTGQVVPRSGILQLTSTVNGRLLKVLHAEGDHVEKGDVILVISAESHPTNGLTPSDMVASLHAAKVRTESELARERSVQSERLAAFTAKSLAIQSETDAIQHQIAIQNQLINTSRDIFALYERSGTTGVVSKVAIVERKQQLQQQRAQLTDYERQLHEKENELAGLRLEKSAANDASAEKVMRWHSELDNVNRELLNIESSREISIVAPDAGTISAVQATPGQSVAQGQVIGTLLPKDSDLIAIALVPSKMIGQLKVGSSARLRLDSFPYQRFGTLPAHIKAISQGPVANSASTGADAGEGHFRLELTVPQSLDGMDGTAYQLRAGMNFSAVLPLERHRIYQWMLPHLFRDSEE